MRGSNSAGFHTTFGDGSTIPDKTIAHVRDTVWKNMVFNRWEKGDILMIDNFRVSHGRQVRYNLIRTLLVVKIVVITYYSLFSPTLAEERLWCLGQCRERGQA